MNTPARAADGELARGVVHEAPPRDPLVFPPRGCVVPRLTAQQQTSWSNSTVGSAHTP